MYSDMTGGRMDVIDKRTEAEIEVRKSRFIAIAMPTGTLEEVKEHVKEIWKEHPGATHVVHAAVIGKSGTLYSSSDDREPKNTAGRPALEVLKGSNLTNITVLIVRYFGGTLLGTGGLVKAYSDATKEVLKKVERHPLMFLSSFSVSFPYSYFTQIKRLYSAEDVRIENSNMNELVTLYCKVDEQKLEKIKKTTLDIGDGKILFTEV